MENVLTNRMTLYNIIIIFLFFFFSGSYTLLDKDVGSTTPSEITLKVQYYEP